MVLNKVGYITEITEEPAGIVREAKALHDPWSERTN